MLIADFGLRVCPSFFKGSCFWARISKRDAFADVEPLACVFSLDEERKVGDFFGAAGDRIGLTCKDRGQE